VPPPLLEANLEVVAPFWVVVVLLKLPPVPPLLEETAEEETGPDPDTAARPEAAPG